ncbi:hypothetical protein [Congregibacter litoralis]|uniref:Uncharacterized protein n=1 Tax=Congregibacter litoralis KT71 TaxID=314285 RepID=A4ABN0_9GAMM|nr:hypothetical protein [Congregibacter litoralis]EAQ96543.1 hypothetical protein KT71_05947 [Congregibacter litoralis KT71]
MKTLASKAALVFSLALFFTLPAAEQAQAGANCGGLHQKSCWNINPKKWCDSGLSYRGNGKPGQGRCVKKKSTSRPKKTCGGLNQSSCWNANPKKWCKGDLQYKPTGVPGTGTCVARKVKQCGGLNQSSCWSANPTEWCSGDLQYKPTGVPGKGTCVARKVKQCGGLNQSSCWSVNPTKWCRGDLKYKPTGIPGQGTCIERIEDEDLRDVAGPIAQRVANLGQNNPLEQLRSCLKRPENFARLRDAMKNRSKNGVNSVLANCGASPQALAEFGNQMLGFSSGSRSSGFRTMNGTRNSSQSAASAKSWNLSIAVVGSAVAYGGIEGAIGYHVTLRSAPEARFYVAGGLAAGVGVSAGVDLALGLGYEEMPSNHWARSNGVSVSYSGKAVYGGGVAVDFGTDSAKPIGITVSGGAGAGAEVGVVTGTVAQYLYNF